MDLKENEAEDARHQATLNTRYDDDSDSSDGGYDKGSDDLPRGENLKELLQSLEELKKKLSNSFASLEDLRIIRDSMCAFVSKFDETSGANNVRSTQTVQPMSYESQNFAFDSAGEGNSNENETNELIGLPPDNPGDDGTMEDDQGVTKPPKKWFTARDKEIILEFLVRTNKVEYVNEDDTWKQLFKENKYKFSYPELRSWESVREHFRQIILRNLENFVGDGKPVPVDVAKRFPKSISVSPRKPSKRMAKEVSSPKRRGVYKQFL